MDEFFGWGETEFYEAQQTALMRLHLYLTGSVHSRLWGCYEQLEAALRRHSDAEGVINPLAGGVLADVTATAWREALIAIRQQFEAARQQAVLIGFASLPYFHNKFTGQAVAERAITEAGPQGPMVGVEPLAFFQPQLEEVLAATADRVYGDGFKLSQRIWNLDQRSLAGIQQIITEGIATGDSAWRVAPKLEAYLGAGQNCPRWTSTRLFRRTKTDIASGDRSGLISGGECGSKGVSYNALRLIRNEIQIAHAAGTDAIFARQPWVQAEKINLSPSHPPIGCRCEDVVNGGDNGDGVYPLGEIALPLHVQCLCYKTGELMRDEEFVRRMRGWVNGSEAWPEMNGYAGWVGATAKTIGEGALLAKMYTQLALPMMTMLNGNEGEVEALFKIDW